jgi:hypothetical protein
MKATRMPSRPWCHSRDRGVDQMEKFDLDTITK